MPRRLRIELEDIASRQNLVAAAYLAASGKRSRPEVVGFFAHLDRNLSGLAATILAEEYRPEAFREFIVRDPKRRTIHAPVFRDRVLQHAIMRLAGPWMDQTLIDDSFACRAGKGPIAAVHRAQHFSRRYPWYLKADIASYFHSIDHSVMIESLRHRFKGDKFLSLLSGIIKGFQTGPFKGLPIGALTSQHFANLYLNLADRWIISQPSVKGYVRYMDDMVIWTDSPTSAKFLREKLGGVVADHLCLSLKSNCPINSSEHGLTFCGHRIFPGTIRLTLRRKRIYHQICDRWEIAYLRGEISARQLQCRYASAFAVTRHADAVNWRRLRMARHIVNEV